MSKSRTHGSRWRRRQMCCRRVCASTPGYWGSNNPVLALSFRRCRTATYTSSVTPRFPTMRLSPRPFGSRSGGRLGVICPELRPPLVAIPSVRDTAHPFGVYGSPSLVLFQRPILLSVSIRMTSFQHGTKDCLPSPQRLAFDRVATSYTLADPDCSGCKPITGKRWVLWRLRHHTGGLTQQPHQLRRSCVSA